MKIKQIMKTQAVRRAISDMGTSILVILVMIAAVAVTTLPGLIVGLVWEKDVKTCMEISFAIIFFGTGIIVTICNVIKKLWRFIRRVKDELKE